MERPNVGQTVRAFCKCANGEATWVITHRVTYVDATRKPKRPLQVTFYYECLSCGNKRKIGVWPAIGDEAVEP